MNELIVEMVTWMLLLYKNNFSIFLDKEGKLKLYAVSWMFPLFFRVHFVPQPFSQRGGSGAEGNAAFVVLSQRELNHKQETVSCPGTAAVQDIKDKHPKKQAKAPISSLKNIKKQYSHPVWKVWVRERILKKKKILESICSWKHNP